MMTQMPMVFLKVAVAALCAAGTTSALSADLTDDVRAALARGERRVTVPKGRYELTTADKVFFRFEGLTNVVIDFSGSKLVFKRRTRYFQLTQCANVTLRNAVLDMDPLPYVQAVIEKVENPGAVWTVRLLDGYDTPFGANVWPCQVYDRKTLETKEWMRLGADFRIEPLGDRRYRVSGGSPDSRGEVGDYCVWSAFEPGEACPPGAVGERSTDGRSWMRRGINLDRCTDCTVEDMTLYTCVGVGFHEFRSSGNVWRRCRLDRCPPEDDIRPRAVRRLRSGIHDGFNSRMCDKGPVLEDCKIAYHCDDAVNICGHYGVVSAVEGRSARILYKAQWCAGGGIVRKGDRLEIMTADGVCKPVEPKVLAVTAAPPRTETELAWFKTLGFWPGQEEVLDSACRVELDAEGVLQKGDVVISTNAQGNGFRIVNCTFGPNRAYGVRLRASHGLVENCTFDHTQGSAVFIGPEYAWLEGGFGNDIVFRGNRYLGYGDRPTTHVGGVGAHRRWIPASAHHNVVPDDKPNK